MLFVHKFIVLKHERGLLFKDGDFIRFLEPGTYRFRGLRRRYDVERFDLAQPLFAHRLVDYLVEAERADIERLFTLVETGANEVAVVYQNERVAEIVGPAQRKLYWKGPVETRVDRFDLDAGLALEAKLVRQFAALSPLRGLGQHGVYSCEVPDGHVGLLYVDGKLTGSLAAGVHAFWTYGPGVKVDVVDLRVKTLGRAGSGDPDPRQGQPAGQPDRDLSVRGCREGRPLGERPAGSPVQGDPVRPARRGRHAHARCVAGGQVGDRPHCRRARWRTLR